MPWKFDYLIVGAGFSGLVIAERITRVLGESVLIVDKRPHIGGNAYDEYDNAGVLVHKYGPHYFRTNSREILDYLSEFTEWTPVDYKIKSFTRGRYWSFPVNLNTFEELIGRKSNEAEFREWLESNRQKIDRPSNSEEIITSQVGQELYKLFFEGYTKKQWNLHPSKLDPSVCGRIPIRTNRDDRYLNEEFQCLPSGGYNLLFKNLLASMGNKARLLLNTDYREILGQIDFKHMFYSGPIDAFYDYRHGALPYRSLRFEFERFGPEELKRRLSISGKPGFWQPSMQVNYPNEEKFTRIVEIKHATGQKCENTSIVREYPEAYTRDAEPYYPVPNQESKAIYRRYKEMADSERDITFLGRLGTYRYYNMDQVVGMALSKFANLRKNRDSTGSRRSS